MKTTLPTALPTFHTHAGIVGGLILATLLLILSSARGVAENPWGSSSLGWSSWESTTGGTFGGSSASHVTSRAAQHGSHSSHHKFHAPPPEAIHDASIDPVMLKAGSIAEHRAQPHSTLLCWRYVKEALVASGGVDSYPQSTFAKQAGGELVHNYGFVRLPVRSADRAPVGSVIVYGGAGAGHVELRTSNGFVSDYSCNRPSGLPFIGAYARLD